MYAIQRVKTKKCKSAFEWGMVVGARLICLSVSRTAMLLDFTRSTVTRVYPEWSTTQRASSQRQACGRKWVIDESGQRRLTRIVQSNRWVTISQLTVQHNIGAQRPKKECTTHHTWIRMGYGSRRQSSTSFSKNVKTEDAVGSGTKTLDLGESD
jgi:hypothetical protein